jgi:hypothetical protein
MSNKGSTARTREATVLRFVSREQQLQLRGRRNYDRYMLFTKGFVKADSPERAQWQREAAKESLRDAEWNERHGPVVGGANILQWQPVNERLTLHRERHNDPALLDAPKV